jgi:hypothetical protein
MPARRTALALPVPEPSRASTASDEKEVILIAPNKKIIP